MFCCTLHRMFNKVMKPSFVVAFHSAGVFDYFCYLHLKSGQDQSGAILRMVAKRHLRVMELGTTINNAIIINKVYNVIMFWLLENITFSCTNKSCQIIILDNPSCYRFWWFENLWMCIFHQLLSDPLLMLYWVPETTDRGGGGGGEQEQEEETFLQPQCILL